MAKGQAAKQEAFAKLLEVFPDSFIYNDRKEVRINTTENGEPIQLKVVITCAKVPVTEGNDSAVPGAGFPEPVKKVETAPVSSEPEVEIKASDDERQAISNLMSELGL